MEVMEVTRVRIVFTYSGLRTVKVWLEEYRDNEAVEAGKVTDL